MSVSLKRKGEEPLDLSLSKRPVANLQSNCFWCQEVTSSSCTDCIVTLPCCGERVHRPCAELAFGKAKYEECKLCTGELPTEFLEPFLDHFKPFEKEDVASLPSTISAERTAQWVNQQMTTTRSSPLPLTWANLPPQGVIAVMRMRGNVQWTNDPISYDFSEEEEDIQIIAEIPRRH